MYGCVVVLGVEERRIGVFVCGVAHAFEAGNFPRSRLVRTAAVNSQNKKIENISTLKGNKQAIRCHSLFWHWTSRGARRMNVIRETLPCVAVLCDEVCGSFLLGVANVVDGGD